MHKQAINHKQAIIGGGYLFTENACFILNEKLWKTENVMFLFLFDLLDKQNVYYLKIVIKIWPSICIGVKNAVKWRRSE